MKKLKMVILTMLAVLLGVMTPAAVLAQEDGTAATADSHPYNGALAIIAPWVTPVGQETSMRVFLRADQEPVAGAGVWALTNDEADALRDEINSLQADSSQATSSADYEALVDARGVFLGRTGDDGRLYHTFSEAGGYVLVTVKGGYYPGFTRIKVREAHQGIGIEAPRRAEPGEEITITTFERATQEPLSGTGVWALTRDNVEALKADVQALREDTSIAAEDKDYEAVISRYAFFLGRTGEEGELDYTFAESGVYLLVAFKPGYYPGFSPIFIRDNSDTLRPAAETPDADVTTVRPQADTASLEPVTRAGNIQQIKY